MPPLDPAADRRTISERLGELDIALAAAKERGDKKEIEKLAKEKAALSRGDHHR